MFSESLTLFKNKKYCISDEIFNKGISISITLNSKSNDIKKNFEIFRGEIYHFKK